MPGFVAWEGPSLFDGTPIGVVVTHLTHDPMNTKLGPMAQAWVLPRDVSPNVAAYDGQDTAVCGDCQFRPTLGGGCYVPIAQAPQRVWYAWRHLRSYTPMPAAGPCRVPDVLETRALRIGAWGDPSAVPIEVWQRLLAFVPKWTSYTEQWRTLPADLWATFCMASVKSSAERAEAKALGWRTFRVRLHGDPVEPGERVCPAADESPTADKATCERCHLCDGRRPTPAPDVTLFAHGAKHQQAAATLAALGGVPDPTAAKALRERRRHPHIRSASMGGKAKRTPAESAELTERKTTALQLLRMKGGISGRALFERVPLGRRGTYPKFMRWLGELEALGLVRRSGHTRTQVWFAVDSDTGAHLRWLLGNGRPWWPLDLIEQALYEPEPQATDALAQLVVAGTVRILPDGRCQL